MIPVSANRQEPKYHISQNQDTHPSIDHAKEEFSLGAAKVQEGVQEHDEQSIESGMITQSAAQQEFKAAQKEQSEGLGVRDIATQDLITGRKNLDIGNVVGDDNMKRRGLSELARGQMKTAMAATIQMDPSKVKTKVEKSNK